jgi:hypothetical protein
MGKITKPEGLLFILDAIRESGDTQDLSGDSSIGNGRRYCRRPDTVKEVISRSRMLECELMS